MDIWDISGWLTRLSTSRPVFHSEADFQHALAWEIQRADPSARLRLETRPEPGVHLDLLVSRLDRARHLAVEVKYLTAGWSGRADGERFDLLNQGAQDIRCYDVVKDISRVERLVHARPGWSGAVVVLTNDPGFWSRPGHDRATNAQDFRIYQDRVLSGRRAWGPATGAGTRKGREDDLDLRGAYRCAWTEYSALPGPRGTFRALLIRIDAADGTLPPAGPSPTERTTPLPTTGSPGAQPGPGRIVPDPPAPAAPKPGQPDVRFSVRRR